MIMAAPGDEGRIGFLLLDRKNPRTSVSRGFGRVKGA
jgi:hypothetical protein